MSLSQNSSHHCLLAEQKIDSKLVIIKYLIVKKSMYFMKDLTEKRTRLARNHRQRPFD